MPRSGFPKGRFVWWPTDKASSRTSWPERILGGQTQAPREMPCKRGLPKTVIKRRFWPVTQTTENVSGWVVRRCTHERPADFPVQTRVCQMLQFTVATHCGMLDRMSEDSFNRPSFKLPLRALGFLLGNGDLSLRISRPRPLLLVLPVALIGRCLSAQTVIQIDRPVPGVEYVGNQFWGGWAMDPNSP